MADFCKQCSIEIFNEDFEDLKNLAGTQDCHCLCEGCGPTIVNPNGECISKECLKGHGRKPN